MGIVIDSERLLLKEVDTSLKEWGRWSSERVGSGLGYPSMAPFIRTRGRFLDDVDMRRVSEVELAWTTWKVVTLASVFGARRRHNLMLLFMLKIHYLESDLTSADKAYHTARNFHVKMSRSQYYVYLREARLKLGMLIY